MRTTRYIYCNCYILKWSKATSITEPALGAPAKLVTVKIKRNKQQATVKFIKLVFGHT